MATWTGSIRVDDPTLQGSLQDVQLLFPVKSTSLSKDAVLRFKSIVATGRIPLHLRCGPVLDVQTSALDTATWFDTVLCPDDAGWETHSIESPVGILVSVDQPKPSDAATPNTTDLLFFAVRSQDIHSPPTPPRSSSPGPETAFIRSVEDVQLQVRAILLSDELDQPHPTSELTPPPSPTSSSIQARFLPPFTRPSPADKKRKSLAATLDEASKRRRLTTKPSPADTFPAPAAPILIPQPSRATSPTPSTATLPSTDLETANKSLLARLVLASLRLHGVSRSDPSFAGTYHAVQRAAAFSLRRQMGTEALAPRTEKVRDLVDKVMGLLMHDPLVEEVSTAGFGMEVGKGKGKEVVKEVVPRRRREPGL